MGYEMPLVTKKIYLPIEYSFIIENENNNFGVFAKAYKEEYGIDLKDIFELKISNDGVYALLFKFPCELYAVSKNDVIERFPNQVNDAVVFTQYTTLPTNETNKILITIGFYSRIESSEIDTGCGFSIMLTQSSTSNIDDLYVTIWDI